MAAVDMADTAGRTRVMLADDHAIVREGYRSLLQKQDRLRVAHRAKLAECDVPRKVVEISVSPTLAGRVARACRL